MLAFKMIEAICYTLSKLEKADKIKLVKLIYLADKYHLVRYGRTLTGDQYYAIQHGPIGSKLLDILNDDPGLSQEEREYSDSLLEKQGAHDYIPSETCKQCDFDMLSETDIEALDFVIEKFGALDTWKGLVEYTHQYPEWSQHEEAIRSGATKREPITNEELLSLLEDDCLAMPPEHVEESRRILTGTYD